MRVRPFNDLLISCDDPLHQGCMVGRRYFAIASKAAQIVDALEDNYPTDTRGCKHVTIKPGESVWAESVRE